jgi:two-component system sensor histidine kinase DesK
MQISHHQEPPKQAGKGVSSGRTAREAPVIASSGVTFQLWRLYQHAWLVCLVFPLIALLSEPVSLGHLALGLLALVGFATGYTWLMWPHPVSQEARARSSFSFLLLGMLGTLALVFSLLYGPAWLWLFIGVSAMAGLLLPMRAAFAVIVLLTLFPLVLTLTMHGGVTGVDWWWLIAFLLLVRGIGLDMIGVARMGSAIRELHTARRELARLAVIEERLRLSRDLHDLLGQTLSVITLKSELARGLVQEEPERCAQELADIERVSRKTLREVREAVAGYRQPNLASELEGARQLLEAAGIGAQIEPIKEALPPALDAALAWTVREGVTNVIRHSCARHCHIHLAHKNNMVGAEVLNDGGEREQEENTVRRGLGLTGLRERVCTLGGYLEAGPCMLQGKEHFRLSVELPLQSQGNAKVFQEE